MNTPYRESTTGRPTHRWLRKVNVAVAPGPHAPPLEQVMDGLLRRFRRLGHSVQETPDDRTDIILATALFGEAVDWRDALLFTARRRFDLNHSPMTCTLVNVTPAALQGRLDHFRTVLDREPPDPSDYDFPGLAPQAYQVLFEQGQRGGPILALERLVQSQAKSIDVLLVVGEDCPLAAYLFNLVGAHPRIEADDPDSFYEDIALRMITAVSTSQVTDHEVGREPISRDLWQRLSTPGAMCEAGRQLGRRNFFTQMVRIDHLIDVPALSDAISSQYSEGCFSTWDPTLEALVATVTGSARPVYKGSITEDELAVIVGLRPDGSGVKVRHVEGKRNDPPSSEAVEMMDMDTVLPSITLGTDWETPAEVPVVRSKLHGHRGIVAYDPNRVEYVPMASPYHHYPVTCATEAQARGIKQAFARAETLRNPDDPRQAAFTVLPGHGTVIVEKWVPGADPFQVIWEAMDAGLLQVDRHVPQGPMGYAPGRDDRMVLKEQ